MLIFSGLLLIPRRWNDEPNSPFPKKKEAIERYHNQYHHRSGPLLFCNHHVHLPNGLALRYGVTEPVLETSRTEARVFARGEALIVNLYAIVERTDVRNHLAWVAVCAQEMPDQLIHSDRFGTGYLDLCCRRLFTSFRKIRRLKGVVGGMCPAYSDSADPRLPDTLCLDCASQPDLLPFPPHLIELANRGSRHLLRLSRQQLNRFRIDLQSKRDLHALRLNH